MIVPGLYYRYKRASDKEILECLDKVKIIRKTHKGEGTVFGYYPLNAKSMKKIKEKPRGYSLTFDATETTNTPIKGLEEYKTIKFLCKSTSRFFLKPDIGEVIDQIELYDRFPWGFDAIYVKDGYETLPGTDGEHHIMEAVLLKKKK